MRYNEEIMKVFKCTGCVEYMKWLTPCYVSGVEEISKCILDHEEQRANWEAVDGYEIRKKDRNQPAI